MTPYPKPDTVFPLCGGAPERVPLRAPRLSALVKPVPEKVGTLSPLGATKLQPAAKTPPATPPTKGRA